MKHELLLSPLSIGSMTMRNRMVMAPMGVEIVGDDGMANDGIVAYYSERARGGVGLIITEVTAIAYPRGANSQHQLGMSDDAFIPALKKLTKGVHDHDGKIAVQLVHHGKVSRVDVKEGREVLVPSIPEWHGSFDMANDLTSEELTMLMAVAGDARPILTAMTTDDIAMVTDTFAQAARRAHEAGFDGVELHGAHGYLLSGFLSKAWNLRDDEYGGSIENRSRFLCEVIEACRVAVNDEIPIWIRLDGLEYRTPNGIVFEDARITAKMAQEAGAAAIHLSAYGDSTSASAFTEGTLPHTPASHADLTQQLKEDLDIPIIAVGRITPDIGEQLLKDGKADAVAMGRQMLADPNTAAGVINGKVEDTRPCINCYVCVAQPFFDKRVRCAVNPVLGKEVTLGEVERTKAAQSKRVVIVGGGPAGMEAARVASLRGHEVTLLEASDQLGGALRFAALVYEPNLRLLTWMLRQMRTLNVDVRLGTVASAGLISGMSPDAVFVATGAARTASSLPGSDQTHVMDGDHLRTMLTGAGDRQAANAKLPVAIRLAADLGRRLKITTDPQRLSKLTHAYMPVGKQVTIVGGGLVGIEIAEFLVDRKREVTVIEEGPTMAPQMAHPRRWRVLSDLRDHGATLLTGATPERITGTHVVYSTQPDDRGEGGGEATVAADTVVIATGLIGDESVADNLERAGLPVTRLGDCTGVTYLEGAIHDGFNAAVALG